MSDIGNIQDAILSGRTSLGIELGSTRIKACLVGEDPSMVLAVGSHEWENQFVDRVWTYSLEAVWSGLQAAYADLVADVARRYDVTPQTFGAIGVSAMMHGYLAFDADDEPPRPVPHLAEHDDRASGERAHRAVRHQHPAPLVDRAPLPGGPRRGAARS